MSPETDPNAPAIAVETSGRIGSVAVGRGSDILASDRFSTRMAHGVELLPMVDRLTRASGLTPDEIAAVFVSGGPGSFTGLRIGISFAKAFAYAKGAAVVRVPTLEVIAHNALDLPDPPSRVAVLLDAKRKNVFCAAFDCTGDAYRRIDEPAEREPAAYLSSLLAKGPLAILGEGIPYHQAAIDSVPGVTVLPDALAAARAETVYNLGRSAAARNEWTPIDDLIPIYIRRPEAEEMWEERQKAAEK